jgi:DNA-directed RNA polymerase subunit RPC12/RpoP
MAHHGLILCQHCKSQAQLYLCDTCETQLGDMLDQIPWLLDELEARIQCLDRISTGTIGRNRRADQLNVMDFDAAETSRKTRKTLLHWVETIAERHTGRKPPALNTAATKHLARWLQANTNAIARLDCAGSVYHDINKIVGSDQKGGELVGAINRTERRFAGPCPTIRGHDSRGRPIECAHSLYADIDDETVTCPACKSTINVKKNRLKASVDRDLLTEPKILEALDDLDEKVSRVKLYEWIKAGKLKPRGWIHDGQIIPVRIRRGDPRVFSLSRVRQLRWADVESKKNAHA